MKRAIVAGVLVVSGAFPAAAQDTAEKVGIAAALGLTAGSGKTTMADGSGSIEAGLLASGAIDETGKIIAGVARTYAGTRNVLVVSRNEQIDLITARVVRDRLTSLKAALDMAVQHAAERAALAERMKQEAKKGRKGGGSNYSQSLEPLNAEPATEAATATDASSAKPATSKTGFALSDIGAALATDVSIASIPLTIDDRFLIQSIAMNGEAPPLPATADWTKPDDARGNAAPATRATLIVPAEIAYADNNGVLDDYESLVTSTDAQRASKDAEVKSIVGAIDAYVQSLTTIPEGGGASPLGLAIQLDTIGKQPPYILRVAAEQSGGTSTVSGNIWYTLGFPGAATVGAGLVASFRLVDPMSGRSRVAGMVRCAVRRVSVRSVETMVLPDDGKRPRVICAYRAKEITLP